MPTPTITAPRTFPTNLNPVVTNDDASLIAQIAKSIQAEDRANAAENLQIVAAMKSGKVTPDWDVNARCQKAGKQPGVGGMIKETGIKTGVAVGAPVGLTLGIGVSSAVAGAATAGVGALLAVGFALIEHHKQAVLREDTFLCDIVPKVNTSIAQIDQAFQSGQITAVEASTAFAQLYALTSQALQAITKKCNASCLICARLKAIGMYRTITYQRVESARAAAAQASSSGSGPLGDAGTPGGGIGLGTAAAVIAGTAALVH
jgi:hypothetical protein